ncbi:MAG: hypothetical protein NTY83_02365 [Candidatus Micrarchaeota archaeon]|nr:hypothetical protein [Candidatus Micrarchaeota archaeon]
MQEMKTLNLALLLLPIFIVPLALIPLLLLGIPFSPDSGDMFTSPLFLVISVLTIIGFITNFGIVLPMAKKNRGALASVLLWPANFIVSGISLAYFTWNMLPFHLFVFPMLVAAAYNYYSFFRKKQNQ